MLGTNDLLQGNSVEAVAGRMETFLKHIPPEKIRILLISPPPMKLGEWVPSQALVEDSGALCREYKALAWRLDVDFADTASWNVPLTFDGVHFTEEGHHVFAKELANHINKGE